MKEHELNNRLSPAQGRLRRGKAIEMTKVAHGARSALTVGFGIMLVLTLSGSRSNDVLGNWG